MSETNSKWRVQQVIETIDWNAIGVYGGQALALATAFGLGAVVSSWRGWFERLRPAVVELIGNGQKVIEIIRDHPPLPTIKPAPAADPAPVTTVTTTVTTTEGTVNQ